MHRKASSTLEVGTVRVPLLAPWVQTLPSTLPSAPFPGDLGIHLSFQRQVSGWVTSGSFKRLVKRVGLERVRHPLPPWEAAQPGPGSQRRLLLRRRVAGVGHAAERVWSVPRPAPGARFSPQCVGAEVRGSYPSSQSQSTVSES